MKGQIFEKEIENGWMYGFVSSHFTNDILPTS